MTSVEGLTTARAVTHGPSSHFFGYYEKTPWSGDGRFLLALRTDADDTRMPGPADVAEVGMVDLADGGHWIPLAQTRAWNWQQGCMLQWLPTAPNEKVVFNDRGSEAGEVVSRVLEVATGHTRTLPRPVYSLSRDGRTALSINFGRQARCRPVTGYAQAEGEKGPLHSAPSDDGIWRMDMETGECGLLLSFAEVAARMGDDTSPGAPAHWFEHLVWNPDDSRFLFLQRFVPKGAPTFHTRLFTVAADGSDLRLLSGAGYVSHFDWRDPAHILAWARHPDNRTGDGYLVFTDSPDPEARVNVPMIGKGALTRDGHCSFSPDKQWLLTDEYPDAERRSPLLLWRWPDGPRVELGRFYQPPHLTRDLRCDLHPRWNRDGRQVCIDSAHEGGRRQVFVLDVGAIVGPAR
jgi:hypothetical protein